MNILDNINQINKLDKSNIYGSIIELPKQCSHAWEDAQDIEVPKSYKKVNKIIMTGMGGSGLGARIIESVFADEIKYPLVRLNDYDLPAWVDEKTLVICSSFSGTTEETVSTARQAQKNNCQWMAIGTGCDLIDLAKKHKVPYYQINPTYNPSKQPRMANGYSVIGQLILASKAGVIKFTQQDLDGLIAVMYKIIKQSNINQTSTKNPAKQLAQKIFHKQAVFVAARHLTGALHTFKNQMNENAKNLSHRHDVPELNHHLMEGLRFPGSNKKDVVFFFAQSNLYPKRIQQRIRISLDVVRKNKIACFQWHPTAKTELTQSFELFQFGGLVDFYLAMLNGLDPAPIPWVDYFKTKLGQSLGQWK